jgi:hypothetical protein
MPITATEIIAGAPQHDGRIRYRYRYTHSEGPVTEFDRNLTPVGFDAAADAAAKIPDIEAQEKDKEVRRIEQEIIAGAAYPAIRDAAIFNTAAEVDTFLMKRTANRLRPLNADTIRDDAHAVVQMEIVFQASGPEIGALLGISTTDANNFKSEVQALVDGVKLYDTSFLPTYPEVE